MCWQASLFLSPPPFSQLLSCPPFSQQFGDEKRLMSHHQKLENTIEDQLCLAAIHYLRTHYQEAIDIYKKVLLDNRYLTPSHPHTLTPSHP